MQTTDRLAPCGIDCQGCTIFQAAQDPIKAESLAAEWRASGMEKARADWFRCQGCRGDRSVCWSDDCQIYQCCVEERGLASCSACDDFPCDALTEWSKTAEHHKTAFERLQAMRS